jgi:DNA-binding PadR family transcriptional regulator
MSSIRLLILGVLKRKEPIHGYEVRHELEVWGADKWANVAYGSIYSALNKMKEHYSMKFLRDSS